jgi:hypothetical protein
MSAFGIDIFNFEFWNGPPPTVAKQHTLAHTRAGANGLALQLVGKWGEPFEVTLTSHHTSTVSAVTAFSLMNSAIGTGWLSVKYADLNYTGLYSMGYHALDVQQVALQKAILLIGPGYSYTNGGILVTRWRLQPEEL